MMVEVQHRGMWEVGAHRDRMVWDEVVFTQRVYITYKKTNKYTNKQTHAQTNK